MTSFDKTFNQTSGAQAAEIPSQPLKAISVDSVSAEREQLLKRLIQKVAALRPTKTLPANDTTVHEIVMEAQVDGSRYCVVRCRPCTNASVSLSPRERAIAKLIAEGLPNKCIGHQLGISPWTVATYIRRIFAKLGVTSRTAMIAQLLAKNLL